MSSPIDGKGPQSESYYSQYRDEHGNPARNKSPEPGSSTTSKQDAATNLPYYNHPDYYNRPLPTEESTKPSRSSSRKDATDIPYYHHPDYYNRPLPTDESTKPPCPIPKNDPTTFSHYHDRNYYNRPQLSAESTNPSSSQPTTAQQEGAKSTSEYDLSTSHHYKMYRPHGKHQYGRKQPSPGASATEQKENVGSTTTTGDSDSEEEKMSAEDNGKTSSANENVATEHHRQPFEGIPLRMRAPTSTMGAMVDFD